MLNAKEKRIINKIAHNIFLKNNIFCRIYLKNSIGDEDIAERGFNLLSSTKYREYNLQTIFYLSIEEKKLMILESNDLKDLLDNQTHQKAINTTAALLKDENISTAIIFWLKNIKNITSQTKIIKIPTQFIYEDN